MSENSTGAKKLSAVDDETVVEEGNRVVNFLKRNGKRIAVTTAVILVSASVGYVARDIVSAPVEELEPVTTEVETTKTVKTSK